MIPCSALAYVMSLFSTSTFCHETGSEEARFVSLAFAPLVLRASLFGGRSHLLEGGRESATGDLPNLVLAGGVEELCVLAGGGLHASNADSLAGDLFQATVLFKEILHAEAALLDPATRPLPTQSPAEHSLDRGSGVVDIVSIQAEPGLEPVMSSVRRRTEEIFSMSSIVPHR